MSFGKTVLLYAVTLAVFFAIDMVWLGALARGFYRRHLGPLMAAKVVWPAAAAFYLLFVAGLTIFVIWPSLAACQGSLARPVLFGALFGLIAYATYDLTNLATLKDWPPIMTCVDLIWGTVLGGLVSLAGAAFGRWLLRP